MSGSLPQQWRRGVVTEAMKPDGTTTSYCDRADLQDAIVAVSRLLSQGGGVCFRIWRDNELLGSFGPVSTSRAVAEKKKEEVVPTAKATESPIIVMLCTGKIPSRSYAFAEPCASVAEGLDKLAKTDGQDAGLALYYNGRQWVLPSFLSVPPALTK